MQGRLLPVYEGGFASRNPASTMQAGERQLVAGVNGVIMGRFGFADLVTGQVDNSRTSAAQQLGFVLPQIGTWAKIYCDAGTWILREGLMVTLNVTGDFFARFAGGAYPGQAVWASTVDGSAIAYPADWTADSGIVTADSNVFTADGGTAELTAWKVLSPAAPGCLAEIGVWQTFSPN